MNTPPRLQTSPPSFAELYTPKLITVIQEGYGLRQLSADAIAGLTVAIVALPLSMAIAIASGASPAQGLYTAIVGGFLVSLLGGSRFQIGGPAGAFIVLVAATVAQHGLDGLILATFHINSIFFQMNNDDAGNNYIRSLPHLWFASSECDSPFDSIINQLFGCSHGLFVNNRNTPVCCS